MERGDFDQDARARFVQAIRTGATLETAAALVGTSRSSIYYHLRATAGFQADVETAVEAARATRRKAPAVELTPELMARIVDLAEAGASRNAIAKDVGVGARTFTRWMSLGAAGRPPFRDLALAVVQAETRARKAAAPPSSPRLALVPSTTAKAEAPTDKPARDTRPVVREAQVTAALVAAAEAMRGPLEPPNMAASPPRWGIHEAWARLRSSFHVLPDAVRRECLARLVVEEVARIEHDQGASMHRPRSISTARRGED